MDFKKLFRKLISDSETTKVPPTIIAAFNFQFNSPINTEWHKSNDCYEAVFYRNELEHIATYQENGIYVSLKVNLPLERVPAPIRDAIKTEGEIMSTIEITNNKGKYFESIIRDKKHHRFAILLTHKGIIMDKKSI
ncbi:hypothetical protein [Labilibaculum sp.]|uniref:hypothetical protein n=1 Tax=Labilibaculum sp. TaxID=2060723 RepID=UPI00356938F1